MRWSFPLLLLLLRLFFFLTLQCLGKVTSIDQTIRVRCRHTRRVEHVESSLEEHRGEVVESVAKLGVSWPDCCRLNLEALPEMEFGRVVVAEVNLESANDVVCGSDFWMFGADRPLIYTESLAVIPESKLEFALVV